MCGIAAYVGSGEVGAILLGSIKRIEYRGYDSAGIAVVSEGGIEIKKGVGRVEELDRKLDFTSLSGTVGIAHTRWATHGGVTTENAHPHLSCDKRVSLVHNGIIENYQELRSLLLGSGHRFSSETDTEVLPHLIESYMAQGSTPIDAVVETVSRLKGSYAFTAIFHDHPYIVVGARKEAPLVIGLGSKGNFLASDIVAFIEHTDRVVFVNSGEIAVVGKDWYRIVGFDGKTVSRAPTQVAWEASDISKKEFTHYTLKEIHEQDQTVRNTLIQEPTALREFAREMSTGKRLYLSACGTSFHAALIGKLLLAKLVKVSAEAFVASEFTQMKDFVDGSATVILISQSGETADVLNVARISAEKGARVLSIVNSLGSTLARESSRVLSLNCGPEIGVAATKSFTSQLALLTLLSMKMGDRALGLEGDLEGLQNALRQSLSLEEQIKVIAEKYYRSSDIYLIGRGLHFPVALEGALKMKELAYIHAEGLPSGELKHGPLALIEQGTPTIVINPEDEGYTDTLSNAWEVKARGASVIGISNRPEPVYDELIRIPNTNPILYPILEAVPLQLLAFHTALIRGADIDKPRNLAKSVTVR